ncbi:LysR substrate-binding domain-containing protein [Kordiimonas sp.]|uniref:LysR substrate-binding domain-containing protein n=1 Tax=Kordiimonas sp. TaxID=1970157 RepID=UPI003A8EFC85
MLRENLNDLLAFVAVARERSFTKAAAKLSVSQSALSHKMRGLEERLGIRLLTRTTRSVAPTDAGEQLLQSLIPHFEQMELELSALSEHRDKPAGSLRITTSELATETILSPALETFLPEYPDIQVELVIDHGFTDIVAERYDAGVRFGSAVEKDMVAVRIGPDTRMAIVATPDYFSTHGTPRVPGDLVEHNCLMSRLPSRGGIYAWEFVKGGKQVSVHVKGQLTFNTSRPRYKAALAGLGLACIPEDLVLADIAAGRLQRVLEDWCPAITGFHLYYPSRRQHPLAFKLLLEHLRYRE